MMMMMMSVVVASLASDSACRPSRTEKGWVFEAPVLSDAGYNCKSGRGGVNDMGNRPQMCDMDPTSVLLNLRPRRAECLKAIAVRYMFRSFSFSHVRRGQTNFFSSQNVESPCATSCLLITNLTR